MVEDKTTVRYHCVACAYFNWKKIKPILKKCPLCGTDGLKLIKSEKDKEKVMEDRIKSFREKIHHSPEYTVRMIVNQFSNKVCGVLKDKRIKKKDWPEKLGLSKHFLNKFLDGDSKMTIEEMVRISFILDIIPEIIFKDQYND